MAINRDAYELLRWAGTQDTVNWDKVLTLGRQSILLPTWELKEWENLAPEGVSFGDFIARVDDASVGEELIGRLGAKTVDSMDNSPYEGANVIHNLNEPIPEHLKLSYDVVFDGGTLEHIFDYPAALANAMQMVKEGGWFLSIAPSNMWCGHGFYQLSPEVYRTALSERHGFELKLMAFALSKFQKEYWVCDQQALKSSERLGISSKYPACLLVAARRVSSKTPAALAVQQSDYEVRWQGNESAQPEKTDESLPTDRPSGLWKIALMGKIFVPQPIRSRLLWFLHLQKLKNLLQKGLHRRRTLLP
ncbi:MAG: hypothetical protein ACSHX9_01960 [Luteolibacter sp.]